VGRHRLVAVLEQVRAARESAEDDQPPTDPDQFLRDQETARRTFLRMLPPELREQLLKNSPTFQHHRTGEDRTRGPQGPVGRGPALGQLIAWST